MKNISIDAVDVNISSSISGYVSVSMSVNEMDLSSLIEDMDIDDVVSFLKDKGYKIEEP